MNSKHSSVNEVRDDILVAIAEVRTVARSEHDEQRNSTADWLDGQFIDVTDARTLRAAASNALTLYAGMGSFADVGTAASAHAVDQLADALRHARTLGI
ncbi:hypothetical protein [Arthrobacter glacialis]|uniref:Uncharacterized protein n=1 Tax=Arthrobacter glacialis TaxID=1664 RepID=A0A2S4A1W0_ARTGL|nr:hypothetical protein [Arthrobacter glacialis]POH61163.1 hypothetical protein CVS28_01300 [Arthrobacter glacialis]POH75299.1 hypothetical protein CVS27_01460 [Arthrobacter glacialis]